MMPTSILDRTEAIEAILRQATRADLPAIASIRQAVRENMLFPGTIITPEQVREAIETTGRGWVIEVDSESGSGSSIAAFAIGNAVTGSIWALFVHPSAEGRGYGRHLHQTMVDWLWSKGLTTLWLDTDPDTRAHRFYHRLGWQQTGVTPDGEVHMELHRPVL